MEDKKELLTEERTLVLQALADYTVRKGKKQTFAEAYPEVKDEYGKLNSHQEALLHAYLVASFKEHGSDLEKILAAKEEKLKVGDSLTEFEKNVLINEADNLLGILAVILERKEKLKK
jgi:hypothetical protein